MAEGSFMPADQVSRSDAHDVGAVRQDDSRLPCATTMPEPPAVLKVVVYAPLLLQNTIPCQLLGDDVAVAGPACPVVVRYWHAACACVRVTSAVVTATLAELVMACGCTHARLSVCW